MALSNEGGSAPFIDCRSDTVTQPTPAMYRRMATAVLGDDGLGDDPTVKELEFVGARLAGKDAALLVPSGTMGNLIALLAWAERGSEIVGEAQSHVFISELGGLSVLAGLYPRPIVGERGKMALDEVEDALRPAFGARTLRTGLLWLENTHTASGGQVLDIAYCNAAADLAHLHNIRVHLDGARLFNAATVLGATIATLAGPADSVLLALSKGLSAPAGSLLCGGRDFIDRARGFRKMLGGTMRQSGILAAAGLVALVEMPDSLAADHVNARALALAIAAIDARFVDPHEVSTNIVLVDVSWTGWTAQSWVASLAQLGILSMIARTANLRFVTHRHVGEPEVNRVAQALAVIHQEVLG